MTMHVPGVVDRHSIQPGGKTAISTKSIQILEDFHKDFLGGFLCSLPRTQQAKAKSKHPILMPQHKLLKGTSVTV